jgi:hypothetical protein
MGVCACQHCHGSQAGQYFDDELVWTSTKLEYTEVVSINGADIDGDPTDIAGPYNTNGETRGGASTVDGEFNRLRPEYAIIGHWYGDAGPVTLCEAGHAFCEAKFDISQWSESGVTAYLPGTGQYEGDRACEVTNTTCAATMKWQEVAPRSWFNVSNTDNKWHMYHINDWTCKDCLGTFKSHWGGQATGNTVHSGTKFGVSGTSLSQYDGKYLDHPSILMLSKSTNEFYRSVSQYVTGTGTSTSDPWFANIQECVVAVLANEKCLKIPGTSLVGWTGT